MHIIENAVRVCCMAANNGVYTVVVDIGPVDILDFGVVLNHAMHAAGVQYSTIEFGKNPSEVIIRGILPE